MAQDFAKSFYKSKPWQACRTSYINKRMLIDGGVCEECGEQPGYIVHHEVTLTADNIKNPDITLNHDLMKYVCKSCHDEYEGHGVGNKHKSLLCDFGPDGQPLPP